jgi:16S rRNA (uracil1498-N3)-methyltransferase
MRRYWVRPTDIIGGTVRLEGEIFHHIFGVCRQELGSRFEVLCDQKAYFVEVTEVGKKSATALIKETRTIPELPRPHLHVALSVSRYQVMDDVVEKLVEMGVASFHPFFSDFSFVRNANSFPQQKLERWHKIVISATQQCGRGELMQIHEPVEFKKITQQINQTSGQLGLFAYEGEAPQNIGEFLESHKSPNITDIWCIIGSEGGFSAQEVQTLTKLGFNPVTLGPQVLRVETACLTLVSVLKYEFDLMRAEP